MIIAEWKPIPELIESLAGHRRVLLAGCATCVAECATGGEREVETLAPLLRMGTKTAGHPVELVTHTAERQCELELIEPLAPLVEGVDAVMSLACGIGIQTVAERFADVPMIPGVNTTALAVRAAPGLWETRCAACGDCRLSETFGLCTVSRCAKSVSNGPCGGTRPDGKCEIEPELDCVWHLVIQRAMKFDALDRLLEVRPPKDWSGSDHYGPTRMTRDEHRS